MSSGITAWSAAWDQFLIGKRTMLAAYRRAQEHSRELKVQTHHGFVGEAEVRAWLEAFLPKRYAITAGYIRGQRLRTPFDYAHFDVIVYDQVESPVLWVESNPDKSSSGRTRIIPAEHVLAVVEVKAAFHRRSVEEALAKLDQLEPLMANVDAQDERYPTYLPATAVLAMMFFELRQEHSNDFAALELLRRTSTLRRVIYGPVILSGEGRSDDETGLAPLSVSDQALGEPLELPGGLLAHLYMSATVAKEHQHFGTMLTWSDMHFADFAFDLLALMKGTYRRGFASSFHGIDLSKLRE